MLPPVVARNAFFGFGNSALIFNNSSTKTFNLMKKVNFKMVLMTLSVAFTFLFVGMNTAMAQQSTGEGIQAPAQGNFMNSDEAGVALNSEITVMGTALSGMTPGTPLYNATRRKALYYRGIYMEIQNGNAVSQSIGLGFGHLLNNVVDAKGASKSVLLQLRQDAIALLSI